MMPYGPDPGAAPPGWMGTTPAALGYGVGVGGMVQAQQQGSSLFGGSLVNSATNAMSGGWNALQFGSMTVAPLMASYGMSAATRGLGTAWSLADPFQYALMGGRFGWSMGGGALSAAGRFGMGRAAFSGALGMAGATALGLPAMAAAQMPIEYANHAFTGARNAMLGYATLQGVGPSAFPGQTPSAGQGAAFGQDLSASARLLGTSTDDMAQITRQLDQMKVFQTTRTVSEFRSRFKEVMGALKEISLATKQTIEEATQTFGELRQQGFYTTSDITSQAARNSARSAVSGVAPQVLSQYGAAGAQTARSLGMRGRVGSDFMTQSVASVASAYRSMSPALQEAVNEQGGPEEAAARMADRQMAFLSTARGRALIAASMGAGGAPDSNRLGKILGGGMTTEGIVESAAGRGLGVLYAAGLRENREKFMPFAEMAMVNMAMSQSRQLYGGVSERGLTQMLGTMGMSRDDSKIMLADLMQKPKFLDDTQKAATYSLQQAEWQKLSERSSLTGRASRAWGHYTDEWEREGGSAWSSAADWYKRTANRLSGYSETVSGPAAVAGARKYLSSGHTDPGIGRAFEGGSLLGPKSERERMLHEFGGLAIQTHRGKHGDYVDDQGKVYDPSQVVEMTPYGSAGTSVGSTLIMTRDAIAKANSIAATPPTPFNAGVTAGIQRVLNSGYMNGGLTDSVTGFLGLGSDSRSLEADRQRYRSFKGSGPTKLTDEELNAFLLLRKQGSFTLSIEDYIRMKSEDPKKFVGLRSSLRELADKELGGTKAEDILGSPASLNAFDREGAKTRLGEGLDKLFRAASRVRNPWQAHTGGDGRAGLTEKIKSNTELAGAFSEFMQAQQLTDLGGRDIASQAALQKVKGIDEGAYNELQLMDPTELKRMGNLYSKSGLDEAIGAFDTATVVGSHVDRESSALNSRAARVQRYNRDPSDKKGEAPRSGEEEAAISALRNAGTDPSKRGVAYANLYKSLGKGGFTEEERGFLTEATGGSEAADITRLIESASKGDKDALKSLGLDEGEVTKAMSGHGHKKKNRLDTIIDMALEKHTLDPALRDGGGTGTGVDGTGGSYTEYVTANKTFVTEVSKFVQVMGKTFPNLNTAGDGVTGTSDSVPATGGSNWFNATFGGGN